MQHNLVKELEAISYKKLISGVSIFFLQNNNRAHLTFLGRGMEGWIIRNKSFVLNLFSLFVTVWSLRVVPSIDGYQCLTRPGPSTFPRQSWPPLHLTLVETWPYQGPRVLGVGKSDPINLAGSNNFCQVFKIFHHISICKCENQKLHGKYHLHTLSQKEE